MASLRIAAIVMLGAAGAVSAAVAPLPRLAADRQVHDPTGWLPAAKRQAIEARLANLRRDDEIDIRVVVMANPPAIPGQAAAERLASRIDEGRAQAHAVVLQIIGAEGGPWIAVDGRMLRVAGPAAVTASLDEARARIAVTGDPVGRVDAAVEELEDFLRFLSYRGRYREERLRTLRTTQALELMKSRLRWRVALLTGGLLLLVSGLALVGGRLYWRRFYAPRWFPATSWRQRFGAPYCGGNDAVASLAPRVRRDNI